MVGFKSDLLKVRRTLEAMLISTPKEYDCTDDVFVKREDKL